MREDGTTGYVDTPFVIDAEHAHPHDEIIVGPGMIGSERRDTPETLVEGDNGLPLPVMTQSG